MADAKRKIKKIIVNRDLCIGAASCIINAPGVFELDNDNKAIILQQGGKKDSGPALRTTFLDVAIDDDTLLMAAQSCPTKAIYVTDEDDQQVYP